VSPSVHAVHSSGAARSLRRPIVQDGQTLVTYFVGVSQRSGHMLGELLARFVGHSTSDYFWYPAHSERDLEAIGLQAGDHAGRRHVWIADRFLPVNKALKEVSVEPGGRDSRFVRKDRRQGSDSDAR
jgi:hypothetical protein